jgi:hypothetical protein
MSENEVHTNLFGPDGVEATEEQATAVAQSAVVFEALGLAYWSDEGDHGELHLSDSGDVVLRVYNDGHAESPLPLPVAEPEHAAV